jgi:hypothetical protein
VSGVRGSTRQAPGQHAIPKHYRQAAANPPTTHHLHPYATIAEFKVAAVRDEALVGGMVGV